MINLDNLKSVQFVIGQDGHPSAVQMDIETWESLLDWLEANEDRKIVKEMLPKLRSGPRQGAALRWAMVRSDWDRAES